MSNTKTPDAAKSALAAAEAKAKAAKTAEMKDSDLDKVAGGLNPQPLPPGAKSFGGGGGSGQS
jgi:hypothetical protein